MRDGGDKDDLDRARRYFIKASAYAAPAILTTITLNKAHAQATCMPNSCMPAACEPMTCMPAMCMPVVG